MANQDYPYFGSQQVPYYTLDLAKVEKVDYVALVPRHPFPRLEDAFFAVAMLIEAEYLHPNLPSCLIAFVCSQIESLQDWTPLRLSGVSFGQLVQDGFALSSAVTVGPAEGSCSVVGAAVGAAYVGVVIAFADDAVPAAVAEHAVAAETVPVLLVGLLVAEAAAAAAVAAVAFAVVSASAVPSVSEEATVAAVVV